jgi:4-diphosphocytidyl-2-C-methyl-D-erythritol kinase
VSAADGWVRARAPAKINLWLDVLARRADGYHELDTGLAALEWADELRLRRVAGTEVAFSVAGPAATPDVPRDGTNLALRALLLARAELEAGAGLELVLEKRVPSRAGLGAGSADAAAAVLACERVLQRELDPARAMELLAGLGSDCVFFRAAAGTGFARCTGRGERVEPLPAAEQPWHAVVLVPEMGAGTAEVYAALPSPLSRPAAPSTVRGRALQLPEGALRGMLANGLERAALSAVAGLASWRELLDDHGGVHFRLSGSGSSFFGLFRSAEDAERCRSDLDHAARARGFRPRALVVTRLAACGASLL